jgi:hypothetical protein
MLGSVMISWRYLSSPLTIADTAQAGARIAGMLGEVKHQIAERTCM